jgi:cell division protein ZapA
MPQVTVKVNGRDYDLTCGAGEEAHLLELAQYVDAKINSIRGSGVNVANVSDTQLLLMAGIVIADELSDATESSGGLAVLKQSGVDGLADIFDASASRLEAMTARLEAS